MPTFSSKPIAEHAEAPLADDGRWEDIVNHWNDRKGGNATAHEASRSYIVSVGACRDPLARAAQLAEIVALVKSQGGNVLGDEICFLTRSAQATGATSSSFKTCQHTPDNAFCLNRLIFGWAVNVSPSSDQMALGKPRCLRSYSVIASPRSARRFVIRQESDLSRRVEQTGCSTNLLPHF